MVPVQAGGLEPLEQGEGVDGGGEVDGTGLGGQRDDLVALVGGESGAGVDGGDELQQRVLGGVVAGGGRRRAQRLGPEHEGGLEGVGAGALAEQLGAATDVAPRRPHRALPQQHERLDVAETGGSVRSDAAQFGVIAGGVQAAQFTHIHDELQGWGERWLGNKTSPQAIT